MSTLPAVIAYVRDMVKFRGITATVSILGIGDDTVRKILINDRPKLYHKTLDQLYKKLGIPEDDYWKENLAAWNPTGDVSPLAAFLREVRIQKGMTSQQVAKMAKIDVGTLGRIENGRQTPHPFAYTINKLLEIYGCSQQDVDSIKWFIVLSRDLSARAKALKGDALATRHEED